MDEEEVEEIEIGIETPTLTRIPSRGGKIGKTTPDTITKGVKVEAQLITLEETGMVDHPMKTSKGGKKTSEGKEDSLTMTEDIGETEVIAGIGETRTWIATGWVNEDAAGRVSVSEGLLQAPPRPRDLLC